MSSLTALPLGFGVIPLDPPDVQCRDSEEGSVCVSVCVRVRVHVCVCARSCLSVCRAACAVCRVCHRDVPSCVTAMCPRVPPLSRSGAVSRQGRLALGGLSGLSGAGGGAVPGAGAVKGPAGRCSAPRPVSLASRRRRAGRRAGRDAASRPRRQSRGATAAGGDHDPHT